METIVALPGALPFRASLSFSMALCGGTRAIDSGPVREAFARSATGLMPPGTFVLVMPRNTHGRTATLWPA